MKIKKISLNVTCILLLLLIINMIPSSIKAKVVLRPMGGIGASVFMPGHSLDMAVEGGLRLLLQANEKQRYGIECSYVHSNIFENDISKTYISTGFMLEQKLFDWFVMSIGTIGYISLEGGGGAPFGILTNLGWEPKLSGNWSPFITYRAEFIFANSKFIQISSISVGISFFL